MNVLITGAAGFLGRSLCRELGSIGIRCYALDDCSRGAFQKLHLEAPGTEGRSLKADVRDTGLVRSALINFKIDTVFHLAAINGTRNFYERPREVLDVGVAGMQSVGKACEQVGVQNLVLYSSSEVYQTPQTIPTPESEPCKIPDIQNPRYSYGLGKIFSEFWALHSGIWKNVLIIRPHNVYGPDMGYDHVIPELIVKAVRANDRLPVEHPPRGSYQRAFIYVDDFTEAVVKLWQVVSSGLFHVGSNHAVSIDWLAKQILNLVGKHQFGIEPIVGKRGGTLVREPNVSNMLAAFQHAREMKDEGIASFSGIEIDDAVGCRVTFANGLTRTVKWYLEHQDEWPV